MLAAGLAWLLSDCPAEERHVSRLFDLYHCDDVTYQLAVIMDDKQKPLNRAARAAWGAFLQLPSESTRGGVLASAQVHLRLFDSGAVRRATDRTTLDVRGFVEGRPMSPIHHRAAVSPDGVPAAPAIVDFGSGDGADGAGAGSGA